MFLSYIRNRWLFWLLLLAFIVAKIPHLHYGFYWDKSWVYGHAIHLMHQHGPSLLPGAIPLDYSRGHPLLYHALCAEWMNIFGSSLVAMHSFALCLAALTAIAAYEVLLTLFNRTTAIIAVALLLSEPHFFAESSFLLTDVPIALLSLTGIFYYTRQRYILAGIAFAMLVLIKESAWVIFLLVTADILIGLLNKKWPQRSFNKKLISLVLPGIALATFFLAQRNFYGWILYPGHTSAINLDVDNTLANLQAAAKSIFSEEGNIYRYLLISLLLTIAIIRSRKWKRLLWLLYAAVVYVCICISSSKDAVFYIFLGFSALAFSRLFTRQQLNFNEVQMRFIRLLAAFTLLYIAFCCVNFYETRYLLPVIIFISVLFLAIVTAHILRHLSIHATIASVIALIAIGTIVINTTSVEMSAYRRMDVQQHLVDYFEQNNFYNEHISCKTFFGHIHLTDPNTGFLRHNKPFTHVTDTMNSQTRLVIYDNIDSGRPELADEEKAQIKDKALNLIYKYANGLDWVIVYKTK